MTILAMETRRWTQKDLLHLANEQLLLCAVSATIGTLALVVGAYALGAGNHALRNGACAVFALAVATTLAYARRATIVIVAWNHHKELHGDDDGR